MTRAFCQRTRGQTPTDFILGVTLFLATVGAVFALAPVLFGGVMDTPNSSAGPVTDRIAEHLQGGVLSSSDTPDGVLDSECTTAFFSASTSDCRYPTDQDMHVSFGTRASTRVNVSVVNASSGEVVTVDGVTLQRGDVVTSSTSDVSVTTRTVTVDGSPARLVIRTWRVGT